MYPVPDVTPRFPDGRSSLATLGLGLGLAPAAAQPVSTNPGQSSPPWLGPDGDPLPFEDDAAVLEFLQTARVVETEDDPPGHQPAGAPRAGAGRRTGASRLSGGGHREEGRPGRGPLLPALPRLLSPRAGGLRPGAALGLSNVPPATERRIEGRTGSIQLWVEGARDVVGFRPTDVAALDPPGLGQGPLRQPDPQRRSQLGEHAGGVGGAPLADRPHPGLPAGLRAPRPRGPAAGQSRGLDTPRADGPKTT